MKIPGYWPKAWLVAPEVKDQLRTTLEQLLSIERANALRPWDEKELRSAITRLGFRRDEDHEPEEGGAERERELYTLKGDQATIVVRGFILPDGNEWFARLFGWQTYAMIEQAVRAAVEDERVASWTLDFDCAGGAATGCFEAGRALVDLSKAKPSRSYVRGYCASAAYWLACGTNWIVASPDGVLGSIGTATTIVDWSEADKRYGVRVIDLASSQSPRKRPDLTKPDGLRDVQQQLDDLGENFVQWVAGRRRVSRADVIERMGGGACLVATRAFNARMCDEVLELVPGRGRPLPAPTAAPPAASTKSATPAAAPVSVPSNSAVPPVAGAAGRKNVGPQKRAAASGEPMDTFEPQCRAAIASAESCLAVLDAENPDHADCRTACEAVVAAGNAAIEAGEEGLKPGSEQGVALADACDACAEACGGMGESPECVACAASCEACSKAARAQSDSGGAAAPTQSASAGQETQMSQKEVAMLRAENARLKAEAKAAGAAAGATQRGKADLEERVKKLEVTEREEKIAALLERQDARGAIGSEDDRKFWAEDARVRGVEATEKTMARIPDNAYRPTKLRGSDQVPAQIHEDEKKAAERSAQLDQIQKARKCSRVEAMRIWAQQQKNGGAE